MPEVGRVNGIDGRRRMPWLDMTEFLTNWNQGTRNRDVYANS